MSENNSNSKWIYFQPIPGGIDASINSVSISSWLPPGINTSNSDINYHVYYLYFITKIITKLFPFIFDPFITWG